MWRTRFRWRRKACFPVDLPSRKGMQMCFIGGISPTISPSDKLNAIGNEAWAVGEWSCTLEGQNGPVQVKGYDSGIYVRDGDTWKILMATFNVAPLLPRSRWKDASLRLDAPHLSAPRLIVGSSFMGRWQLRSFFAAA